MQRSLLTLVLALSAIACDGLETPGPNTAADPGAELIASSWPVAYLAERVLGAATKVACPIPAGMDPIHWVPDRDALARMQAASLVVLNGAGFEPWAERASLPLSRVLYTARVFEQDWIVREDLEHSHGPRGDHSHSGVDPHTWLDPLLAKAQAGAIRDAWLERDSTGRANIEANFASLAADLGALHSSWQGLSASLDGRSLFASHPAYDYLAGRYGWNVVNFDLDPEAVPTAEQLKALRQSAAEEGAAAMLWESTPTPAVAATVLKATGLVNIVIRPAEVRSDADRAAGRTYLDVQRANIKRLEDALQ